MKSDKDLHTCIPFSCAKMENWELQHSDILATLGDFHQHSLFTDFTVQLKEGSVKISRNLLAAMSPVFKRMLLVDMREKRDSEADLKNITMATWTCVTQFYFGRQNLVSVENVADVLRVSDMYQMDRLVQYCGDFLSSVCSPENCMAVKSLAMLFRLEALAKEATRVLAANFSTVCKSEDFLRLEKTELLELLEKEELVTTEDDVCRALLAWVEARKADAGTCTEVLQYLSLKDVTDDGLRKLVADYRKSCLTLLSRLRLEDENQEKLHPGTPCKVQRAPQRRLPYNWANRLVVVGRTSGQEFCVMLWSPEERIWIRHPMPQAVKRGFSSAVAGGSVFITGGTYSKETHIFDLKTLTWSVAQHLLQERRDHGMAVIEDSVYVVGGYQTHGNVLSIEEYKGYRRKGLRWKHVGDLQFPTRYRGVAHLGHRILTVGDVDGCRRIQTFDVKTRTSTALPFELSCPMRNIQATTAGSTLFFLGNAGVLVQVREKEEELDITGKVKLQGFQCKESFGLHVARTSVTVIDGSRIKSVHCWNLQGEPSEDTDLKDLPTDPPTDLRVLGLHLFRACSE